MCLFRKAISLVLLVLFLSATQTHVAEAIFDVDASTPKNGPPTTLGTTATGPIGSTVTQEKKPPISANSNWSDSPDLTVGVHAFVKRLKYLKADKVGPELSSVIESNKVVVDAERNIIIVTGTYVEYQRVKELLDQMDTPPRQVMFDVEVVEVDLTNQSNLGIDWGSSLALPGGQLTDPTSAFRIQLDAAHTANVTGTLHYLIEHQKGRLLASPRIATLDGVTAHVLIGDKLAVESTQLVSGTSVISVQYVDVGIKLEVTPFINDDGIITTHILPEVSNETTTTAAGNPNIRTRQADTTLRIKSGDTIILGGLIQRQETSDTYKIPLLGNLPVVGKLFSYTNKEETNTELVILITPKIIEGQ